MNDITGFLNKITKKNATTAAKDVPTKELVSLVSFATILLGKRSQKIGWDEMEELCGKFIKELWTIRKR